jgi:hypothetical protein
VIKKSWRDSYGAPLVKGFHKKFFVSRPDTQKPDINRWTIKVPVANSSDQLIILFNEQLDYILSGNSLQIFNKMGELNGTVRIVHNESVFQFVPNSAWLPGDYTLVAAPRLEDLAGNNLKRLFDEETVTDKLASKNVFKRVFTIK